MKSMLRISAVSLLALAIAGPPASALAQTTNKPALEKKAAADKKAATDKAATEKQAATKTEKKASAGPFHGKLAALDKMAKTITVGKRTFLITSETKMFKAGKPATLDDGVVEEEVSGYVKPNDEGKLVATKVTFGPKTTAKSAEKKTDSATKTEKK
jgi:colicin import membrane protein